MTERFSNNATATLAAGIDDTEAVIEMEVDAGSARFYIPSGSDFQRATLYSLDDPDAFEIVYITENDGTNLTVIRGQEGTTAQAWAAGAKIDARVTASMLASFVARDEAGIIRTPSSSFVVNGRTTVEGSAVQISGYPVLPLVSAAPTSSAGASVAQDANMSHEAVGGSLTVDLGDDVPEWVSEASYPDRSIVAPTTPTGFHYVFQAAASGLSAQSIAEPAFDNTGYSIDAVDSSADVVGLWVPIPTPLDFVMTFPSSRGLVVTEVGFFCLDHDATTDPVVKIGTSGAPTRFANDVALTQITGPGYVHRIPITAGGLMVTGGLRFGVTTPATGRFIGRFYWRGFFVQTD